MDFTFSPEQIALRDAVRSFLSAEAPNEYVRRMAEHDDAGVTPEVWRKIVDLGLDRLARSRVGGRARARRGRRRRRAGRDGASRVPGAVLLVGDPRDARGARARPRRTAARPRGRDAARNGRGSTKRATGIRSSACTCELRACAINRAGEIGERRSLIDDFRQNVDTDFRVELLPKIARVHTDDEFPDDVRYWVALHLLRAHLSWHAPYLPPPSKDKVMEKLHDMRKALADDHPWQGAHQGEAWMRNDIRQTQVEQFQRDIQNRAPEEQPRVVAEWAKIADRDSFFWRLNDPNHADVLRSRKLLASIKDEELAAKARRWLAEIERNNTVITLDVTGSYGPAKEAPVVLDVRNAERLSFRPVPCPQGRGLAGGLRSHRHGFHFSRPQPPIFRR